MESPLRFYSKFLALFAVVSLMVGFNFLTWGFHRRQPPKVWQSARARPERGPALIRKYGCGACHTLPSSSARPRVGPSLVRLPDQIYIAGKLSNTPANLMRWIQDPDQIRPRTAMPNLGVGPRPMPATLPLTS